MTTIASDGKTVAADGLRVIGNEPVEYDCKKLKLVNGKLYGVTGVYCYFDPFIAWHEAGAAMDSVPKVSSSTERNNCTLLVFEETGITSYPVECPHPEFFPYPAAFGSGADFATAAMMCGKTPGEAVSIAAQKNIHTAGEILEIEIPRSKIALAAE